MGCESRKWGLKNSKISSAHKKCSLTLEKNNSCGDLVNIIPVRLRKTNLLELIDHERAVKRLKSLGWKHSVLTFLKKNPSWSRSPFIWSIESNLPLGRLTIFQRAMPLKSQGWLRRSKFTSEELKSQEHQSLDECSGIKGGFFSL